MKTSLAILFLLFSWPSLSEDFALDHESMQNFFSTWWELKPSHYQELLDGNTIATSSVESGEEQQDSPWQSLDVKVAGLHPQRCKYSLKKMVRFELYDQYLSVVTKSRYQNKKAWFYLDAPLLPFAMSLEFLVPEIKKPGNYTIVLEKGIFPGLTALLRVRDFTSKTPQCLYTLHAQWKGAKTKIPDIIAQAFTQTLTQKTLEQLMRKTRF